MPRLNTVVVQVQALVVQVLAMPSAIYLVIYLVAAVAKVVGNVTTSIAVPIYATTWKSR